MVVQRTGWWTPVGPLTTVFTPPASCLQHLYYDAATTTVTLGKFGSQPECYPTKYWEEFWGSGIGYYSPAICPSGFTSACGRQTSNNPGPGYTVGPSVRSGETVVKCCPRIATEIEATTMTNDESVGTTTVGTDAAAHAFGIQVRHQSSDLSVLALIGFGSATTTTSLTSGGLTMTTSTPPTPSSTSSSPGLSPGVKIGIGVSVPLVVATLVLLVFLLYRRRVRARAAGASSTFRGLPILQNTEELPPPGLSSEKPKSCQPLQLVHQTHLGNTVVELDSSNLQAANIHHTQPYSHLETFRQPVEAQCTAALHTMFEAGSSDSPATLASELPNNYIIGESYNCTTLGNIPAAYHQGDQTTYNAADRRAPGAVTSTGDSIGANDEITYLETQQEKIRIKREKLRQLEEMDEEESRIQERLTRLKYFKE
ncbi:hypothetical protein BKA66DRAFT_438645 [Pyrenochaeta sp. MPI-SDFR-AT-0127]|nr:hypothetical protein BKA66DRAFT_438645 [Pyrenochaeta sp. MPI-SDFR-AT-0127]